MDNYIYYWYYVVLFDVFMEQCGRSAKKSLNKFKKKHYTNSSSQRNLED